MTAPGPVLVYSKIERDLRRVEALLNKALPAAPFHYASSPQQAVPYLERSRILYGWSFPPDLPQRMPHLRWVQKMGAGVDDLIGHWPFGPDVQLTRTDGKLIAPRMVEYVLGAILDRSIGFDRARRQQASRFWEYYEVGSIRNLTVGVAGLGEIGSEIAAALRFLGATVVGWRKSEVKTPSVSELFAGDAAFPAFLGRCDVLVLVLPLTRETRKIMNARSLDWCRPGVHLINIGRGGLVDEGDLLHAIDSGRIGHATLDVFAAEPLPAEHPFWSHPKISITPHVGGPLIPEDVVPHFIANYLAFAADEPLRNAVDMERQY